eukprot:733138-Rhodomonas_salina.6
MDLIVPLIGAAAEDLINVFVCVSVVPVTCHAVTSRMLLWSRHATLFPGHVPHTPCSFGHVP